MHEVPATPPPASGGGLPHPIPPPVGGRYRLVRLIAQGGMAEVWEGVDEVLARPVAVKRLLPHLARDAAFVERFKREAVAAARLSHPNIVALFDTCSEGDTEAIVMELVRGRTLRDLLDANGALPPAHVVALGAQVADALAHAHHSGLVHRDVKPGNILLSDDGRVLVADFGIAKAAEAANDLTEVGQIVGTAKYLSPEQVEGVPLDARSDVYSLGIVLYEALCGRVPFDAGNPTATAIARLRTTPFRPRQVKPGVPRDLEDAVLRAMARQPDDRFASARDLREALLAVDPSAVDPQAIDPTTGGEGRAPADATTARRADATSAAGRTVGRAPAPSPDPTPPTGVAAFARQERSWIIPAVLIAVVAGTVGLVGALLGQTEVGQDLFDAVRPGPASAPDADEADGADVEPVVVGPAASFDPEPGDGREGEAALAALTDGDDETSWTSERYDSRLFGGLKPGVGVVVTVEGARGLRALEVDSPTAGWSATVHVADEVPDAFDGWGPPVGAVDDVDGSATIDLDLDGTGLEGSGDDASGTRVLLWFTDLGDGSVGSRFSVAVRELRATG